jgi:ATP-binding cassette subfamily B protein
MAVHAMSVGDFAMFQSYLVQIGWPVMALGLTGNSYIKGKVSVERLNEIYDARPEVSDPAPGGSAPVPAPGTAGRLEFRGVRCAYDPGNEVIRGFDLRVAPGEWVGLAGGVGSGKSTLLKLPPRLLDPTAGAVFLDGRDLREWPLRALRAQVALAAQEPFLFGETVLENVAFSRADEADRLRAEAEAALLAADLWETVRALPQGLDTLLGEKGVNLSGGQRRRLALARALFARPKVLLLDDVFSAVDTATEARIAPALRLAAPECAVLLVSHRVSTLRLCDRVLVLEAGGVVEEGSPDALIARGGRFREMAGREELARRAGLEG